MMIDRIFDELKNYQDELCEAHQKEVNYKGCNGVYCSNECNYRLVALFPDEETAIYSSAHFEALFNKHNGCFTFISVEKINYKLPCPLDNDISVEDMNPIEEIE